MTDREAFAIVAAITDRWYDAPEEVEAKEDEPDEDPDEYE